MGDRATAGSERTPWPRRCVLKFLAVPGVGTAAFGRALAEAFQAETDHHLRRPDLDAVLAYREDA